MKRGLENTPGALEVFITHTVILETIHLIDQQQSTTVSFFLSIYTLQRPVCHLNYFSHESFS